MHGFLIHTTDNTLLVRNYEYLKYDNPGWWQDNINVVSSFWEFDSDKPNLMRAIFESLARISKSGMLSVKEVKLFCESIGYDLDKFMKDNATEEARFSKVSKQNWDTGSKAATGGFASETSFNPHNSKSSGD
jgi:hypothetical protein